MGTGYANGNHQTHRSVLDESDASWYLEPDLEADPAAENSIVKTNANKCEPMGIAMGIENDVKAEKDNDHMKESVKNTYTDMAHDSTSRATSLSGVTVLTTISEMINDKTPSTCGITCFTKKLIEFKAKFSL